MQQLTCEMCGGTDLIKQDGVFVCQSCGMKYSVEEAKKMMIEGTVKIDNSDKLSNLYTLARQASDSNDFENAAKYYDLIKQEDPNSWEACFYNVYFRAAQTKIKDIQSAANSIENCLKTVFGLIKNSSDSDDEKKAHVAEVSANVTSICSLFLVGAKSHLSEFCDKAVEANNFDGIVGLRNEYVLRAFAIASAFFVCRDLIEQDYETDTAMMMKTACELWRNGIDIWKNSYAVLEDHASRYSDMKSSYVAKLQKYQSDYLFEAPLYKGFPYGYTLIAKGRSNHDFGVEDSSSGGCYVATAVYGSYDCPQVWTLRRYRDYTLAETWYGRAFIKTYYAISPTLVKWFGHTEWFKKMWKGKLDRMVENLKSEGVEDTPYEDRSW